MCSGARWGRGSRFPEGEGGARRVAPPQNGCSGRACAAARAGGVVRVSQRGEGGARRGAHHRTDVAVGHAQRRAPGGWFAFPGGGGQREPGELVRAFPGGEGRRALVARRVYARGRRGRRSGGWLPCRFARHFVTGRGVAVKWGLRRRSSGVVVKRGCAVVDGGARRFRGVMREGAEGRWPGGFMQEGAGDGGPAGGCRAGLPAIS